MTTIYMYYVPAISKIPSPMHAHTKDLNPSHFDWPAQRIILRKMAGNLNGSNSYNIGLACI
jgi:hypothetical protein